MRVAAYERQNMCRAVLQIRLAAPRLMRQRDGLLNLRGAYRVRIAQNGQARLDDLAFGTAAANHASDQRFAVVVGQEQRAVHVGRDAADQVRDQIASLRRADCVEGLGDEVVHG